MQALCWGQCCCPCSLSFTIFMLSSSGMRPQVHDCKCKLQYIVLTLIHPSLCFFCYGHTFFQSNNLNRHRSQCDKGPKRKSTGFVPLKTEERTMPCPATPTSCLTHEHHDGSLTIVHNVVRPAGLQVLRSSSVLFKGGAISGPNSAK